MEAETPKNNPQLVQAWNVVGADVQRAIDEETRKAELEATRRFLARVDVKALDEMRKSLDLPSEALGALIEIHAKKIAESELSKTPLARRDVLPLSTNELIRPGQTFEITARPQRCAFRPERVFVSDTFDQYDGPWWKRLSPWYKPPQLKGASDWIIHDIKIGNRSQFSQAGSIPADMFRSDSIDVFVTFETAQTAMDIKLIVEYVGACPRGQRFFASMIGTAAI